MAYRLGPLDISDGDGKEVVARFDTDLRSGAQWLTDSNGLQLVRRTRDARAPLWPGGGAAAQYFNQTDAVAGNYYAANMVAALEEQQSSSSSSEGGLARGLGATAAAAAAAAVGGGGDGGGAAAGRRLSVLIDRSEGCSSLASGQLELMVHRRLTAGCRWGMCEPDDHGVMEVAGLNDTLGAEVGLGSGSSMQAGMDREGCDCDCVK